MGAASDQALSSFLRLATSTNPARRSASAATGALEHVVHDGEAVQVAVGEREEDLEPVRFQGDGRGRLLVGMAGQFIPIGIDMCIAQAGPEKAWKGTLSWISSFDRTPVLVFRSLLQAFHPGLPDSSCRLIHGR